MLEPALPLLLGLVLLLVSVAHFGTDRSGAGRISTPTARRLAQPTFAPNLFTRFDSYADAAAALAAHGLLPVPGRVVVAAFNVPDAALEALWPQWTDHYNKKYSSVAQVTQRKTIFKGNVRRVVKGMQDITPRNWYILNSRMDKNYWEVGSSMDLPPIKDDDTQDPKFGTPTGALPVLSPTSQRAVDWRLAGRVSSAKDQGDCNACWAYAALGAMESAILIATNRSFAQSPLDLSEQQMIDCVSVATGYDSNGCANGSLVDAFAYASGESDGPTERFITSEATYPWRGQAGDCDAARLSASSPADKVQLAGSGYEELQQWSASALREAVEIQPVVVGFFISDLFQLYSGGVWPASRCNYSYPGGKPDSAKARITHAMLVVGYNMSASPPYWILKNSWGRGSEWGDDGFALVEMTGEGTYGTCFMYSWMVKPTEVMPRTSDPVVQPPGLGIVRLVNGSDARSGRLEVLHNGIWGTVCEDRFDSVDATVACRQLGLGTSGAATRGAAYGQGRGPIFLDEVGCTGEEVAVEMCPNRGWGRHDCTHKQDVGVECDDAVPGEASVRLVSGDNNLRSGRLEVLRNGVWGTVCDDGFTDAAAGVVCHQLGLGSAGTAVPRAAFGAGSGPIWLDSVRCEGDEVRLQGCSHGPWNVSDCSHDEDVGVRCYGETGEQDILPTVATVRLVNGNNTAATSGRLEVLNKGVWGTVCDDGFGADEATTVCRQLLGRRNTSGIVRPAAFYGPGSGQLWLDSVRCSASVRDSASPRVELCSHSDWGQADCTHNEDVSVTCGVNPQAPATVRLRGGPSARVGRLEVFHANEWGGVCGSGFEPIDAGVACRQMGLGSFGLVLRPGLFNDYPPPPPDRVWLDGVACTGTEARLELCPSNGWGVVSCVGQRTIGINCTAAATAATLRLVGSDPQAGRLEVLNSGVWGMVCDDNFGQTEATVACRQLGLGTWGVPAPATTPADADTPIWLDDVSCRGNESRLEDCGRRAWGDTNCQHAEDISIRCLSDADQPSYGDTCGQRLVGVALSGGTASLLPNLTSFADCCSRCKQPAGCAAVSMDAYGNCQLKGAAGFSQINSPGSLSAILNTTVAGFWTPMGATLPYGVVSSLSLQLTSSGMPLLLYIDPTSTQVFFMRYNGGATGGGWTTTTLARQTGREFYNDAELVLGPGDAPFAAFLWYGWDEVARAAQAKVMVRAADANGTWSAVGQDFVAITGWGDRSYKRLAVSASGRPLLAYADMAQRDSNSTIGALRVLAWQVVQGRQAWFTLIGPVTDRAITGFPGLTTAPNGTVYVAYSDPASGGLLTVKRLDPLGNAWLLVGRSAGISTYACSGPSLALTASGALLAAYRIEAFSYDRTTPAAGVLRFSGGEWAPVGRPALAGSYLPTGLPCYPPREGQYGLPVSLAVAPGSELPLVAIEQQPWTPGTPVLVLSPIDASASGSWEPIGVTPPNAVSSDVLYNKNGIGMAAAGRRVCAAFNDGAGSPEFGLAVKCLNRRV